MVYQLRCPMSGLLSLLLLCASVGVSAQTFYRCGNDSECGEGAVCTVVRVGLGVCTPVGDLMAPCTSSADCTATLESDDGTTHKLICRSVGETISGRYCALDAEPPVPAEFTCTTGSNTCAESGGTCVARSVTFGSPGLCVPVQADNSQQKTCTIGGIPCPNGEKCTSSSSTDVIGEVGLCTADDQSDDGSSNPLPPSTTAGDGSGSGSGSDTASPPDSSGSSLAYCSCTCNGISVPGYMSMLSTGGCSKCNSICWSALFIGCTRQGWQGTWGDTTNPLKGFVSGTCLKGSGGNDGGGNAGGDVDAGNGNGSSGRVIDSASGGNGGGTPPPTDGGKDDGDVQVGVSAALTEAQPQLRFILTLVAAVATATTIALL